MALKNCTGRPLVAGKALFSQDKPKFFEVKEFLGCCGTDLTY
jgi:hypothetical protein